MSRGIFRLKQVYEEQLSGTWSTRDDVWLTPSPFRLAHPFGYFGGGLPQVSTIDRIDYSNDTATASARGPLSSAKRMYAATGNSDFGYFGGGYGGSPLNTVDRIDYTNDTATASVRGSLSLARYRPAATGNSSFGYFGGGYNGTNNYSTVDRIDYTNDTETAVEKGPLSAANGYLAAAGNQSFGYFGGGNLVYLQ